MAKLPPQIHAAYIQAFTNALVTVYVVAAAAVAAFAFLLSWALEQRPLRDRVASASRIGESFAMPKQTDSLAEASRALTVLVGREGGGAWWRASPSGPGSIFPAGCWLLARLDEAPVQISTRRARALRSPGRPERGGCVSSRRER